MFLNHFQFTAQPFAERVSAAALWQDDRMQQGLARLRYLAEQATVGLVTGASGVGKSALLETLPARIAPGRAGNRSICT